MIPLLPKWNLESSRSSFYDRDSVTLLELAGKLHGAINALIGDYNDVMETVNQRMSEYIGSSNQKQETFHSAIRQEFQDFIDVVDLKMKSELKAINDKFIEFQKEIIHQNELLADAEKYMQDNLEASAEQILNAALADGALSISMNYDANNEEISITFEEG